LTGLHTRAVSYIASAHARSSDKRMRTWLRLYCQVCCEEHRYVHQLTAATAFCAFQWYTNPCYLQSMALFFLFALRHVHERVCYKLATCDVIFSWKFIGAVCASRLLALLPLACQPFCLISLGSKSRRRGRDIV
jgi:hypothetical protein